jgi:hypothetical protein
VPIVLKSGSLSLLEPSGPIKACNGIALPLLLATVAYYLHPSAAAQLQRTAIGFVWFGVLIQWSRFWFRTHLHLSTVSYRMMMGANSTRNM